jgi:hypothetical protein
MKCPYFLDEHLNPTAECRATIVPFEPSRIDRIDYCLTGRHRYCPLFRNACNDRSLPINHETTRSLT